MTFTFKHKSTLLLLMFLAPLAASGQTIDLLAQGADSWEPFDEARWKFVDGELHGSTAIFDGDKTDPDASTFIIAREKLEGEYLVSLDVSFDEGRYLGVYLDYGQKTQTGIWIASGHALPADAPDNEIERGYIKTVENGFWIVRATGDLAIAKGERIKLGFSRRGDEFGESNEITEKVAAGFCVVRAAVRCRCPGPGRSPTNDTGARSRSG
jgi:hypothetical protein